MDGLAAVAALAMVLQEDTRARHWLFAVTGARNAQDACRIGGDRFVGENTGVRQGLLELLRQAQPLRSGQRLLQSPVSVVTTAGVN
jgi:hypothetical protein